MPRKKKEEPTKSLEFKFTGKMSVLVELEGHGPMQWRVNDVDAVVKVVRLILETMDNTTPVDSYNKRTENTFRKILDF